MSVSQPLHPSPDAAPANADARPEDEDSDIEALLARFSRRLAHIGAGGFLSEFALTLSDELRADYVAIGRLNPFSNIMRTLRFIAKGELAENIIYSLDGTPCANSLADGVCIHEQDVADAYPHDRDLQNLSISSYAGAALESSAGEKLGVIVVMWQTPMRDSETVQTVLETFRHRVASVIETTEMASRYAWAISNAFGGVWDWDLRTGGTIISDELQRMIALGGGRGPFDLTKIENAIHPEDRARHVEALKKHLNEGAPYELQLRLRDQNGVYRWHLSRGAAIRDAAGKPERMVGGLCDIHDVLVGLEKAARA